MSIAEIKQVLTTDPKARFTKSLLSLKKHFEGNSFISGLPNEETSLVILRNMRYLEVKAGETIFSYGEQGSTLYIVLSGHVDVYVPKSVEVPTERL